MNEPPQRLTGPGGPWKLLAAAILVVLLFNAALYFAIHSREAKLRADLQSRGFKFSLHELAASHIEPSPELNELGEAVRELQRLNFWRLGGGFRLMNLGPSGTPIPAVKADKPFGAVNDPGDNLFNRTWEDLAEAARQAQPALQRIRALARQRIPYGRLGNSPTFDSINVAQALCADALSALRQGSGEAALQDLESLTDFALISSGEQNLIIQIGRSAVIHISVKTCWEMLQSNEWTEPQLRRMEAAWERVLPLPVVERAAEGEVAGLEEVRSELRKELAKAPLRERAGALVGLMDEGWDIQFSLEYFLAYWEAARALERGENWSVFRPGLETLKSRANTQLHSRYRHLELRYCLPHFDATFETCAGNEAARQLLLTDIALRRFKLHHNGALPKTLRELTPEFLAPASGHDVFGGGDLQYRANPDGSYLLYSVGRDGTDDGGDASWGSGQTPFWDSRDMAWPSPAQR